MNTELTAQDIKRIRKRYGLSQQAFARVLGIGEASIVRYENGQKPSRANENLIRAAENESFMLDCLKRDGDRLSPDQRQKAEQIIYAEIRFNEKGDVMDINEIYMITLQQEILNEKAAEMLADLSRMRRAAHEAGDTLREMVYEDATRQLWRAKDAILDNNTEIKLAEVRGQIQCLQHLMEAYNTRAA